MTAENSVPVLIDLDVDVAGQCSLVTACDSETLHAQLRYYSQCKRTDPQETSAIVCVPVSLVRQFAAQLKGMRELDRLHATQLFTNGEKGCYAVFHDAPVKSGLLAVADLPPALRALRQGQPESEQSGVTFMLDARVAGASASCLWDSGAKLNFASRTLVRRLGLSERQTTTRVELADGTELTSTTSVTARVRIGAYRETLSFVVLDLAPGFELVLGDEWSKRHGVIADYGYTASGKQFTPV